MTVSLPIGFRPGAFSMRQFVSQRASGPPSGGSEQVIDLLQDRWMVFLALPSRRPSQSGAIEAFINGLRGMTQVVYLHHFGRPVPRGDLRGAPLSAYVSKGDDHIVVHSGSGNTLKAGDMLGLAGALYQVAADCVRGGDGQISIPIVNRVRKTLPVDTPVVWDRPSAPFRLVSPVALQHLPGYAEGVSLDFVEDVTT